jgi:hypothetical protein
MWQITLLSRPYLFPWNDDFFPRKFYYKRDAVALQVMVHVNGGKTELTRVKK